ncbi:MAG: hypothetical protein JXM70_18020 [Pirellulales bacterium]|nr:hypothetical protein [Pirellulales bacterium]
MKLIQIDHNPPRRQLNIFGLIWLVFFGFVGGSMLYKGGPISPAIVLCSLAIVVPIIGWMSPAFMRIVYLGMAYAALPIGLVVSYLILAIVYYLVLTPIGLCMRMVGYDPMNRRFDPDSQTYWIPCETDTDIKAYFRQF